MVGMFRLAQQSGIPCATSRSLSPLTIAPRSSLSRPSSRIQLISSSMTADLVRHLRNDALQPIADRAVAFGKADERPQHDLAAIIDGIPAGLGDVVVADVIGVDVDGDQ